jgi:hypothetical protein
MRDRSGSALFFTGSGGAAGAPSTITLAATPRRLTRPGIVRIRGRLRPALGGETALVGRFDPRTGRWQTQTARVASNGSFTTEWRIGRRAVFVAQWRGDADRNGDGSPPLTVDVRGR